jgi:hypothetical protein
VVNAIDSMSLLVDLIAVLLAADACFVRRHHYASDGNIDNSISLFTPLTLCVSRFPPEKRRALAVLNCVAVGNAAATCTDSMCPRLLHIVNTCTREANYVGRLIQLRCLGSLAAVTASNHCTAIQTSAATCHPSMPLVGSACALQCNLIPPSVRRQPSQSAGGAKE